MSYCITFDDRANGFTSFHSFLPEAMLSLRNSFFTVKNGQLYKHNSSAVARNNFYGEQFTSQIKTVINDAPSDDKIFKTLVIEGNKSWDAVVSTNLESSSVDADEFNQRESRYFAHLRKSEDSDDLRGHSAQGIGSILGVSGSQLTFSNVPDSANIGDKIYQLNGSTQEEVGTISAINGVLITVSSVVNTPVNGRFAFIKKNTRIEGAEMRGYYLEVSLENSDTDRTELFDVSSNAVKSYL